MSALERALARAETGFDGALARLLEFLRIPSVGTDPARAADTRRAAHWLAAQLREIGLAVELVETPGHPLVLASGGSGPVHVLYYGHYDVQPAAREDGWSGDPFEPRIVPGPHGRRVVARGACDDKGQLLTIVEALRAWREVAGELPVRVTLLVEGEEESGSVHLPQALRKLRDRLAADVAVISDTAMIAPDHPAITILLRGIVYAEVELRGPARDLHSGIFGGIACNPLHDLARFLASLHDERGLVALPGFYDSVRALPAEITRSWEDLSDYAARLLAATGQERACGEEGRGLLERLWARPCLDVNGVVGGYTGEGAKTVIPARAVAKFSCRIVPDQKADEVFAAIERACRERLPEGAWTLRDLGRGDPVLVDPQLPALGVAKRALAAVFGREPALVGCGGSIPVGALFSRELGLPPLFVGFGLDDDGVHGPDEKFELELFRRGILAHLHMLAGFAGMA